MFVPTTPASDSDRLAPARCFASPARTHVTHERNETISRLKNSLRKLRLIFSNLRYRFWLSGKVRNLSFSS